MKKFDLNRPIRNLRDLTEEEKGVLKLAFLLPSGVIALIFLLTPFISYILE